MGVIIEFENDAVDFTSKEGFRMSDLRKYLPISFPLLTAETGGGGDCFFRSLTYLLNKGSDRLGESTIVPTDHIKCRELIAQYIDTPEKADEIVSDMAGQWPSKRDELMESGKKTLGEFDPVKLWNGTCVLEPMARVNAIKGVITRPGNFYWGDSITASIAEEVFGIRIACMRYDGNRVTITNYPYGTSKKLTQGSESVKTKWDRPVVVLINHGGVHWTPVFLPKRDTNVDFIFDPSSFEATFKEILGDS